MGRTVGRILCLVLLILVSAATAQLGSAAAHQRDRFTRLGSDSAEGNQGADLLYLDVAQRDDDLIVRFGIDQGRVLREQSEMSLITWNFSVNTWRIYKINAFLDEERYELLNASDTDSEDCADGVGYLAGSFDRKLGVLTLRVPLSLLGIRGPATIGTNNYNDCYTGLPDVRSYFRVTTERLGNVYSDRTDDFLIDREFRTK